MHVVFPIPTDQFWPLIALGLFEHLELCVVSSLMDGFSLSALAETHNAQRKLDSEMKTHTENGSHCTNLQF